MDCTGIKTSFIKVTASISMMRHSQSYRKKAWFTSAAVQEKISWNGENAFTPGIVARAISLDENSMLCV
jgi:hypothetical protein